MKTLSDGTPIKAQEEALDKLEQCLQETLDENDQEILVELKGYVSKRSKKVANITLNLIYDYHDLLEETLEHVEGFTTSDFDSKIASQKTWKSAQKEVIKSLKASLQKKNKRDNISGAAESIFDFLPTVMVGLASGLVQIRGIITEYKLIKKGTKKKVNSSKSTLVKNELLEGTFKGKGSIGTLKTLALEKERFDEMIINGTSFRSDDFYSDVEDDAIRVYTGKHGHSERIQLSERGDIAKVKIGTDDKAYRVVFEHTVKGTSKKVSQIRSKNKIPSSAIALAEITSQKTIRSKTLVGHKGKGKGMAIHEIQGKSTKTQKVGPSPNSTTYVEVKRENKKIKVGESVIFVQRGSNQIVVNLNWTRKGNNLDLDLGAFVELHTGLKQVLQPLDERYGTLDSPPYVLHSGDDRTGSSEDGEFLFVEIENLQEIKRICIYAMIYSGISRWDQADAVVTVQVPNRNPIEVLMSDFDTSKRQYAVCMIQIEDDYLQVEKLGTFHRNGVYTNAQGTTTIDIDETYNWGMHWRTGYKD
jgi:uncharacterized protein involved in tellurium resistance